MKEKDCLENVNSCSICLSSYVEGEELVVLPCDDRHYFHSTCLRDWMKNKTDCPLCRVDFR